MDKKNFFVSYNSKDEKWAKWIAGTLEENDYTVCLQAWDITPGDDFIESMNNFLECSENYIPVLSSAFWDSSYCKKEFQSAFNAHLEKEIERFLPIRIEDGTIGKLYKTMVYIDLFNVEESKATNMLLKELDILRKKEKKVHFQAEPIPTRIKTICQKLLLNRYFQGYPIKVLVL